MAETLTSRVTRIEKNLAEITDLVKVLVNAQIETEKRFQRTDERIDKLVSAIGELIRRQNGKH